MCVTLEEALSSVEPSPNDHSYSATVLADEFDREPLKDDADPAGADGLLTPKSSANRRGLSSVP